MLLAVQPAAAQNVDYDTDDDRLIEIDSPAKLNALRYDLDGDGSVDSAGDATSYAAGFPNPASGQCPTSCQGYELTVDLDLSTAYPSWTPIGTFNATFDGGGHSISGLTVSVSGGAGLFSSLGASGTIRKVGLVNPSVTNSANQQPAGALVGLTTAGASIAASYVSGGRVSVSGAQSEAGGLVGQNGGRIRASYASAAVGHTGNPGGISLGGLVGVNFSAEIVASYAAGAVTASSGANAVAGGLAGTSDGSADAITDSYCNITVNSGNCVGANINSSTATAPGYTTRQLRRPTGYAGIYANWNIDLDGDPMTDDDPWDFGTHRNYPLLKIDKNGDGRATCEEFSGQPCYVYIPPSPPPYNPAHDHPEIYANPRHQMATSCAVETTGEGDEAVSTSTLTFDLGTYTRPITLALSLWDGTHFRSLQSQNISMPELRQEGQTATVEVVTDPAQTRFRLDSQYGLNLVLGYADCHTDDP